MFIQLALQVRAKCALGIVCIVLAQMLSCTCGGESPTTQGEAVIDATTHGAVGNGTTLNTLRIQAAIDSLSRRGGGVLRFPAGRYLTGTIELKDNVRLRLSEDATILGSPNPADYPNHDPFTSGSGEHLGYAVVTALAATHIGIEGPGLIDGQGKALKAAQKEYKVRPFLVRFER